MDERKEFIDSNGAGLACELVTDGTTVQFALSREGAGAKLDRTLAQFQVTDGSGSYRYEVVKDGTAPHVIQVVNEDESRHKLDLGVDRPALARIDKACGIVIDGTVDDEGVHAFLGSVQQVIRKERAEVAVSGPIGALIARLNTELAKPELDNETREAVIFARLQLETMQVTVHNSVIGARENLRSSGNSPEIVDDTDAVARSAHIYPLLISNFLGNPELGGRGDLYNTSRSAGLPYDRVELVLDVLGFGTDLKGFGEFASRLPRVITAPTTNEAYILDGSRTIGHFLLQKNNYGISRSMRITQFDGSNQPMLAPVVRRIPGAISGTTRIDTSATVVIDQKLAIDAVLQEIHEGLRPETKLEMPEFKGKGILLN